MIRFSKYIWIYIFVSGFVIIPGVVSLFFYGLKPSIDFAGGTLFEIIVDSRIKQNDIESAASKGGLILSSIQASGQDSYILRAKEEDSTKFVKLIDTLNIRASGSAQVSRQETVGPVLGSELLAKAITAAVLALIVILGYVANAFKNIRFGIAAILALIHDLLVMLGLFSIFGKYWGVEVDTLFVTAALTTMSFSMHDTIVVFDRIREYQKKGLNLSFDEICDKALTETMGRSLTNSMTIILMLIALALMGGSSVKWFTVALLVGTVSGTYSSDFVATPIVILWQRWINRKRSK
jgi:preprotein translocase subunit SecF